MFSTFSIVNDFRMFKNSFWIRINLANKCFKHTSKKYNLTITRKNKFQTYNTQ